MKKLKLHTAEAGGVSQIFRSVAVVKKLKLHAAEAGGVSQIFRSVAVVTKLKLHAAEAGGVLVSQNVHVLRPVDFFVTL